MVGSMQPTEMADFYTKVFGKDPDMKEGTWSGWSVGSCFFSVGEHSDCAGKANDPARMMFNMETTEVKEEFERIKTAGATVIKEPYEMEGAWIATLADPDGNYFQLASPWEEEK